MSYHKKHNFQNQLSLFLNIDEENGGNGGGGNGGGNGNGGNGNGGPMTSGTTGLPTSGEDTFRRTSRLFKTIILFILHGIILRKIKSIKTNLINN